MQNRIIKFRAWDKKRKCFIGSDYPNNWDDDRDEWYCDINMMDLTGIEYSCENPDLIVEQYTGLKDKNGKEIFEGDNIKYLKFICTVKYINGHYYLDVLSEKGLFWFTDMACGTLEIIGNIHEAVETKGNL